jgi:RNA polymerase sigma-70 factor (ECF subfamily)
VSRTEPRRPDVSTDAVVEQVFRAETAVVVAALARWLGDIDLAEDAVQEAYIEALDHWARDGVPNNPGAWVTVTARRRALDRLRRDRVGQAKLALLAAEPAVEPDDRLGLVFACCHPSLSRESQVALTLRAVGGLSTAEIASAFLVSEPTMAARITRAKHTLRDLGVPVAVPDPDELDERLGQVLTVIYLVYNEGYLSTAPVSAQRRELAIEAVQLARLLQDLMPTEPEVLGLLALLVLHESRAAARFDGWGRLVLLRDQDRRRWDADGIRAGTELLERALAMRRPGPFQVQAAIAALHAQAPSYGATDWAQIVRLYDDLMVRSPSAVIALNRVVAVAEVSGPARALAELEPLADELATYRLFHATRAVLLRQLDRPEEARDADLRALELASNPAERELLTRRLGGPG